MIGYNRRPVKSIHTPCRRLPGDDHDRPVMRTLRRILFDFASTLLVRSNDITEFLRQTKEKEECP